MIPKYSIGLKLWSFNFKIMKFQLMEIAQIVIKKDAITYCTKDSVYFDENDLFLTKDDGIDAMQKKFEEMREEQHNHKSKFKLF